MSRLDNLGDYNIVRDDLYKFGGDAAKLYKNIADTAVAEKTPALLIKGGLIGGAVILAVDFGTRAVIKGAKYMKNRKKLLAEKPNLERKLAEQMEKTSDQMDDSCEKTDDNEE